MKGFKQKDLLSFGFKLPSVELTPPLRRVPVMFLALRSTWVDRGRGQRAGPGGTDGAARYSAPANWLLKPASHKHFPSRCPDSSSADLNGDLRFFPFLITVQASLPARFL